MMGFASLLVTFLPLDNRTVPAGTKNSGALVGAGTRLGTFIGLGVPSMSSGGNTVLNSRSLPWTDSGIWTVDASRTGSGTCTVDASRAGWFFHSSPAASATMAARPSDHARRCDLRLPVGGAGRLTPRAGSSGSASRDTASLVRNASSADLPARACSRSMASIRRSSPSSGRSWVERLAFMVQAWVGSLRSRQARRVWRARCRRLRKVVMSIPRAAAIRSPGSSR